MTASYGTPFDFIAIFGYYHSLYLPFVSELLYLPQTFTDCVSLTFLRQPLVFGDKFFLTPLKKDSIKSASKLFVIQQEANQILIKNKIITQKFLEKLTLE